jgi:membrane protein DedA with SNARE-associated domain
MESVNKSALAIQLVATIIQCVCWYLIGRADGKKKALKEKGTITKQQ